ncbi:MAG: right-handed parallel beta-helix repeat-containing protein [Geothrix sp.]|nr:right-handed parallel beta-helix repeat-containing protein [Geothrix sp.]
MPSSTLIANVKDALFGAKGDGVTDDTKAIQKAVDAVGGKGGTVQVPDGIYLVNALAQSGRNGIVLRNNMTLRLSGGAVLKVIPNSAQSYTLLAVTSVSHVNIVGGTLEGDRSTHIGTAGEGGMGIQIQDSQHIVVQGVLARECRSDGFYITNTNTDVTFCRVGADHNRRQGMSIVGGTGILVKDSTFSNTGGILPEYGIDIEPNPGETVSHITISGCTFTGNAGGGLAAGPAFVNRASAFVTQLLITGNTFAGNGVGGINPSDGVGVGVSACDGTTVSNNIVSTTAGNGIVLRSQATHTTVSGNTATQNSVDGIYLEDCAGSVVSSNTATGNGGYGIHNVAGSGATLSGNTVYGNGRAP